MAITSAVPAQLLETTRTSCVGLLWAIAAPGIAAIATAIPATSVRATLPAISGTADYPALLARAMPYTPVTVTSAIRPTSTQATGSPQSTADS